MLLFELLAEKKIAEAVSRGELDDLPGKGRPLAIEDDPLVPEELRVAHRILKNAGYVPEEVRALGERKLTAMKVRMEQRYYAKAVRRLSRGRR